MAHELASGTMTGIVTTQNSVVRLNHEVIPHRSVHEQTKSVVANQIVELVRQLSESRANTHQLEEQLSELKPLHIGVMIEREV